MANRKHGCVAGCGGARLCLAEHVSCDEDGSPGGYAAMRFARGCNSVSGTVNSAKPQSRQTTTRGKINIAGRSIPFSPGKWMLISVSNSFCLSDPHDLHGMKTSCACEAQTKRSGLVCVDLEWTLYHRRVCQDVKEKLIL